MNVVSELIGRLSGHLSGHLWTVGPALLNRVAPPQEPASEPWSTIVDDVVRGSVRLTGRLSQREESSTLVVLVHGIGGRPQSGYCIGMARAVERAGFACLRLALRGADRQGEDFYHIGLTGDIGAALRSSELSSYRRVFLVGFSLGGSVCLRAAIDGVDPRIQAVAAICAPLDLQAAQHVIDSRSRWLYRRSMLNDLKEIYRAVARRQPVPTPVHLTETASTIWQWDAWTVVPRFGFASPEDYYRTAGVAGRLERLPVPALVVAGLRDPIVSPTIIHRAVAAAPSPLVEVRWVDAGGHVHFPSRLDMGLGGPLGIGGQIMQWLGRH